MLRKLMLLVLATVGLAACDQDAYEKVGRKMKIYSYHCRTLTALYLDGKPYSVRIPPNSADKGPVEIEVQVTHRDYNDPLAPTANIRVEATVVDDLGQMTEIYSLYFQEGQPAPYIKVTPLSFRTSCGGAYTPY